MAINKLTEIIAQSCGIVNHPRFAQEIFKNVSKLCRLQAEQFPSLKFFFNGFANLCHSFEKSKLQESFTAINMLRARRLASYLVDDTGQISFDKIPDLISGLTLKQFCIGPKRELDGIRQEHIIYVLKTIDQSEALKKLLNGLYPPENNRLAERLINLSLQRIDYHKRLTSADVKKAVLIACFTYLRQNIGSCFATAPAIIIQSTDIYQMVQDLSDLIHFCQLKKIVAGFEYVVPLSKGVGSGELKKPVQIIREGKNYQPEIWFSPGLISAFEEIHILNKNDSYLEKAAKLKKKIILYFKEKFAVDSFIITTDEIINFFAHKESKRSSDLAKRAEEKFNSWTECPLLKAWEFTLASLSETKLKLTSWNLYASLGMSNQEEGGIGKKIYDAVNANLDETKHDIADLDRQIEASLVLVQTAESRLKHLANDSDANWSKADYQNKKAQYNYLLEQREDLMLKSNSLVKFYDDLYDTYERLFKNYFQEVYDPDIEEVSSNPYDDAPAGFSLMFKHGRKDPLSWTMIKDAQTFVQCLIDFFLMTELEISFDLPPGLQPVLTNVISEVVLHLRSDEFIQTAFDRMALAHKTAPIKDPLNNLHLIEKKPWVYTSGGSMSNLISCYYGLDDEPSQTNIWIENELELLTFVIDTVKLLQFKEQKQIQQNRSRAALLAHSPTHAFSIKPGKEPFYTAWQTDIYTYTYARDNFVIPAQAFFGSIILNKDAINYLIDNLSAKLPPDLRAKLFDISSALEGPQTPITFYEFLSSRLKSLGSFGRTISRFLSYEEISSTLYQELPLFSVYEAEQKITEVLQALSFDKQKINEAWQQLSFLRGSAIIGAKSFHQVCKNMVSILSAEACFEIDYHAKIFEIMRQFNFCSPMPFIFADTNWIEGEFAFVVNPCSMKLELWKSDYVGASGFPITSWKKWLNGSKPNSKWGIYNKMSEYINLPLIQ